MYQPLCIVSLKCSNELADLGSDEIMPKLEEMLLDSGSYLVEAVYIIESIAVPAKGHLNQEVEAFIQQQIVDYQHVHQKQKTSQKKLFMQKCEAQKPYLYLAKAVQFIQEVQFLSGGL